MKIINTSLFLFLFHIYFLFITQSYAQDSLYLVGTITGESYDKRIIDVKGIGDVNGDGYDDFMISYRDNVMKLFLGSPTLDLLPDITFNPPGNDTTLSIGTSSGIGDVNNDGFDDFTIRGSFSEYPKGKVFLYFGAEIIDTIPVTEFYEPWIQDYFGQSLEGIGDINNDGYDDFIIGSPYNWTTARGYAYLFWGGDTISWARSLTFTSPQDTLEDFFGQSVATIGDINNNGFADIAVGAPAWLSGHDTGKVYIYYSTNQIDTIYDTIITANDFEYSFGSKIESAGDLNKNGVNDFFIGSEDQRLFLYLDIDSLIQIDGALLGLGGYINIESNCDINNDKFSDFIIGNTNFKNADSVMVGAAFVYLGGEKINTDYVLKIEGENQWGEFSKNMTTVDINGDGFDEILILASGYPDYQNPLGKVYIYSYKNIVDVKNEGNNLLLDFKLYQNYPNPFNPSTMIGYRLPVNDHIKMTVYDLLGSEMVTLINEEKPAGKYEIEFDASKYNLSSGVYFCELTIKGDALSIIGVESQRIKMLLLK